MFIFTLIYITLVFTRILWRMRNSTEVFIMMTDYVHMTRNSKRPQFSRTVAKIGHNWIDLYYTDDIFNNFWILTYQEFKGTISYDVRLWKPTNIHNDRHFNWWYAGATMCAYSYVLAYGQEHSTGTYFHCLHYAWNKYMQCFNICEIQCNNFQWCPIMLTWHQFKMAASSCPAQPHHSPPC